MARRIPMGIRNRIASKTQLSRGCRLWVGSKKMDGLPKISYRRADGRMVTRPVRLVLWELVHPDRPLDRGQVVMTTCGHKRCVAVAHLCVMDRGEILSQAAKNTARVRPRYRALDLEKAKQLIREHQSGDSVRTLARRYKIAIAHVHCVLAGRRWGKAWWEVIGKHRPENVA